jgi:hypothetical protein
MLGRGARPAAINALVQQLQSSLNLQDPRKLQIGAKISGGKAPARTPRPMPAAPTATPGPMTAAQGAEISSLMQQLGGYEEPGVFGPGSKTSRRAVMRPTGG